MGRAIVLVLDSLGIGATPDAHRFGDTGANTLAHIALACADGQADLAGVRQGSLAIPNMTALGLMQAMFDCVEQTGDPVADTNAFTRLKSQYAQTASGTNTLMTGVGSSYGYCAELSAGKDTPSGHWEMMGLPVTFDWTCFPDTRPCFPVELTDALIQQADLPGVLANCHGSGTDILMQWGEEHIRTGKPIIYTSADSVFQIAAHEQHFGLEKLYQTCQVARELVDPYNVGRVIARPFTGETSETFVRTANRRDLTTPPHQPTLLDRLSGSGREVIGIGKISDIFATRGVTTTVKAADNMALFDATLSACQTAADGSLIFTNFVDFDMLFGHRRDVAGYAAALEAFDRRLPELYRLLNTDDLVILTADHGCDPTWAGSDHTREHVPMIVSGQNVKAKALGPRETFADIGQTLADYFQLSPLSSGTSCLATITR